MVQMALAAELALFFADVFQILESWMKRLRDHPAQRWKKRGCCRLGGFEIRTDGTRVGFPKSNLVIVLGFNREGPYQLLRLLEKLGAHMRDFFVNGLHGHARGDGS